jgi:hypothetical protein
MYVLVVLLKQKGTVLLCFVKSVFGFILVLDCILKQMGYRKKESGVMVFSSDGCEIH